VLLRSFILNTPPPIIIIIALRCQGYLEKGMAPLMSDTFALSKLVERYSTSAPAVQNLKSIEFEWLFVTPDW